MTPKYSYLLALSLFVNILLVMLLVTLAGQYNAQLRWQIAHPLIVRELDPNADYTMTQAQVDALHTCKESPYQHNLIK